jgi:L-asparaginase II
MGSKNQFANAVKSSVAAKKKLLGQYISSFASVHRSGMIMENPILVEIWRGARMESRHRGAIAVADPTGKLVLALGDVEGAVYPRSAVKALQALPLVESGAADRLGLQSEEIALACASHSGEPIHTQTALAMLAKVGRDGSCLECGAHWPIAETAQHALSARGEWPSALHNNCSGKHAGFVCLAVDMKTDSKRYINPEHKVQQRVRDALEQMTGISLATAPVAIDGCSIPTYPIPLCALATAFAKLASGFGLAPERAAAARRIRESVAQHPHMVAGTGRFDTEFMSVLRERAFTKTGAEGVFCAALPESGFGIALKCDDGSTRAAELMMACVLDRFVVLQDHERRLLAPRLAPVLRNWNGIEVGSIRAVGALAKAARLRG